MPESASQKPRIAVIGLGSMGFGMATSLRRAGFDVTGCDVSADAVARFVAEGGGGATTPAQGGQGAPAGQPAQGGQGAWGGQQGGQSAPGPQQNDPWAAGGSDEPPF